MLQAWIRKCMELGWVPTAQGSPAFFNVEGNPLERWNAGTSGPAGPDHLAPSFSRSRAVFMNVTNAQLLVTDER